MLFYCFPVPSASVPFDGRSALDACELMNVGINYLREHVDPTTRMHYSYLAAGEKPNVVPDYAAVHYFIRTKDLKYGYEVLERVRKVAAGAAMMTETDYKLTINVLAAGCIQISAFNDFFYEAMKKVPCTPVWRRRSVATILRSTRRSSNRGAPIWMHNLPKKATSSRSSPNATPNTYEPPSNGDCFTDSRRVFLHSSHKGGDIGPR